MMNITSKLSSFLLKNKEQRLLVLIYHQVFTEKNPYFPNEPDTHTFNQQMSILHEQFNVVSLPEGLKMLDNKTLPVKSVAITFDDGYQSCLSNALPILKKYNLPASFFIPTDAMDDGTMWNDKLFQLIHKTKEKSLALPNHIKYDLSSVRKKISAFHKLNDELKFMLPQERDAFILCLKQQLGLVDFSRVIMTSKEVEILHNDGFEIGSHSKAHPIFSMLEVDQAKEEFLHSHDKLKSIVSADISGFAYPNGKFGRDYNEETITIISETPYQYAVSTNWGIVTPSTNKLALPRFTPWDNTPFKFYLRLISKFVFPISRVNKDANH